MWELVLDEELLVLLEEIIEEESGVVRVPLERLVERGRVVGDGEQRLSWSD